jgi:hypothetical protein
VQPSKRRGANKGADAKKATGAKTSAGAKKAAGAKKSAGAKTTGGENAAGGKRAAPARRTSKHPLLEIGRARRKQDALAGVERWKARHPEAARHLEPADVLVDAMRGRFTTWTRVRVNLQHVPPELRPEREPLDPDDEKLSGWES